MNEVMEERWLRGAVPEVPALLQPAAHALLQSKDEVYRYLKDFPEELLWEKPSGRAAVGFHLLHLTGVLDRMLTYALEEGRLLSEQQYVFLKNETNPKVEKGIREMIQDFDDKVADALTYFKSVSEHSLTAYRTVGRKKLPSTVIGLVFHAAEHSQRHVGQMLVTISVLKS